jgi:ankyrin repeat protein
MGRVWLLAALLVALAATRTRGEAAPRNATVEDEETAEAARAHACAEGECEAASGAANDVATRNYYEAGQPSSPAKERRLLEAVAAGDVAGVAAALASGANPRCRGLERLGWLPPIHLAARAAHPRVLELLLLAGADPWAASERSGDTRQFAPALFYAVGLARPYPARGTGHAAVVSLLVEAARGRPRLLELRSALPSHRVLLEFRGPQVGAPADASRWTALLWAAASAFPAAVDALLRGGASANATVQGLWVGTNALHLACLGAGEPGSLEVARSLLLAGTSLLARDKRGHTPLHVCVQRYGVEMAAALLAHAAGDAAATHCPPLLEELLLAEDEAGETVFTHAERAPALPAMRSLLLQYATRCGLEAAEGGGAEALIAPRDNRIPATLREAWERAPRGEWSWTRETPLDSDVCDLERRDFRSLSPAQFEREYVLPARPVVLTGNLTSSWRAWRRWTRPAFLRHYGSLQLAAGVIPYGELYKRVHANHTASAFVARETAAGNASQRVEALTRARADADDAPWIVFDDDVDMKHPEFAADHSPPMPLFGRAGYRPCQLSMGGLGAGAQWHHHWEAANGVRAWACVRGRARRADFSCARSAAIWPQAVAAVAARAAARAAERERVEQEHGPLLLQHAPAALGSTCALRRAPNPASPRSRPHSRVRRALGRVPATRGDRV